MAEANLDPVAAWQKFISDWERQVNEASTRVTGTEEFGRAMNQVSQFQMAAQQQFDKQIEQFLKTVHLPSKSDIAAINDRLAAIEDALDRLTQALARGDRADAERPAKAPIARTRQPPPESV